MTAVCVAPGCTVLGEHSVRCPDDPANGGEGVGACGGCLPTLAATPMHLCIWHFDRLGQLYQEYQEWKALVDAADGGRLVAPDGKSGSPDGWANLSAQYIAIDACWRALRSMKGTLNRWVETVEGATDAVEFMRHAQHAIRLQVSEHKPKIFRERCPHCGLLTVRGHVPVEKRHHTVVECEWCRGELARVDERTEHLLSSLDCEGNDHLGCERVSCKCGCHSLGPGRKGISTLWDGDRGFPVRGDWFTDGRLLWQAEQEERTA